MSNSGQKPLAAVTPQSKFSSTNIAAGNTVFCMDDDEFVTESQNVRKPFLSEKFFCLVGVWWLYLQCLVIT